MSEKNSLISDYQFKVITESIALITKAMPIYMTVLIVFIGYIFNNPMYSIATRKYAVAAGMIVTVGGMIFNMTIAYWIVYRGGGILRETISNMSNDIQSNQLLFKFNGSVKKAFFLSCIVWFAVSITFLGGLIYLYLYQ